jgi:hypothetical protein
VFGTRIIYTGKESNRYEDVESEIVESWGEVRETFEDPDQTHWREFVVPRLKQVRCSDLAHATGKSERYMKALRNEKRQPSAEVRQILVNIASER